MHTICVNIGSKHDLRQLKEFVCSRSNYSLSVLNMGSKHYSLQAIKFVSGHLTYTHL